MVDVLKMIEGLRAGLWSQYGDVLVRPYEQEEVHLTYYVGELLRRRGFQWFKSGEADGACYTEKAMHAAFIAGRRIGLQEAQRIADEQVAERLAAAREALS